MAQSTKIKIWLESKCNSDMLFMANEKYPRETGGILMGYTTESGDKVITDIIGAGPLAKHELYIFEPDYKYQNIEVGNIYDKSNGVTTYLGDWHTHPDTQPIMSDLDLACMEKISKTESALCPEPLILIMGNSRFSNTNCFLCGVKDPFKPVIYNATGIKL